ncbi:hypothetical protein PENSTE_c015G00435 [Penicillium steckii]|uniref:RRM domain-containing protein n=1 Tax=Penicillium steckii TaxID=303698 RepID=A0A1V6T072_9EURO|nr:hypothetical protein PENSTE_c015G00435 [Penicillium steckii]
MDRSLDEIIAEDPVSFELDSGFDYRMQQLTPSFLLSAQDIPSLGSALLFLNRIILRRDTIVASPLEARRLANDEETAAKTEKSTPYTQDRVDLNLDWVHDKFHDDSRDSRPRGPRRRHSPERGSALTKVRVENLHYDITESDLEDLFGRIGPVSALNLAYDRAGRSEGVAYITYAHLKDAHTSIQEFDGANAKGQPIRLSLIPGRRGGDRGDRGDRGSSLFDRIERPGRDARSLSPGSDHGDGSRRRRGGPGRGRRSDVTKPAPEHIDRYVPGERSPNRRAGGRRGGRDNRQRNTENGGRRTGNARPRKTQEELDQEMEDYWGGNDAPAETTAAQPEQAVAQPAPAETAAAPAAAAPVTADDDIDMIE